jgi:hypothetical protein
MADRIRFEGRADAGTYTLCVLDFTDITTAEIAINVIEDAQRRIIAMPPASVRVLVDVEGSFMSLPVIAALERLALADAPYVQRSAITGLSFAHRVVLRHIRRITGRDIRDFTSRGDALAYLQAES